MNESIKMHTISGNKRFMTKTAIPILRKYGIKNMNKVKLEALIKENPGAAAAAAMAAVMLLNKDTGRKNKAITALRNTDNPSHGKAVGIWIHQTECNLLIVHSFYFILLTIKTLSRIYFVTPDL